MLAGLVGQGSRATTVGASADTGIHKIKHVVMIMQENRSFDSYFGTYPGADGIPMQNGVPAVCVPDPQTYTCVKPYHDAQDLNRGGPHKASDATADIAGGATDGFICARLLPAPVDSSHGRRVARTGGNRLV
jgi:phospholipase C